MRRLGPVLLVLAVLFFSFEVGSAIYYKENTGYLKITTNDRNSSISIYQPDKKTITAGRGSAELRLPSGSYKIIATSDHNQSSAKINIGKRMKLSESLALSSPAAPAQASTYDDANTLIKLLPYTGPANEYVVSYSYQIKDNVAVPNINISAFSKANRQKALDWIKSLALDPTKMNITYVSSAE